MARFRKRLGHPGHGACRGRVEAIDGARKQGLARAAYGVLIGVAQFAGAFCGMRRAPNAKLVFTPAR
eukprot:10287641-Lingulodinium_polyedra.AAC.1